MTLDYVFPADEYLLLGKVTKAHGLHGELKIFLYSGQPENIAEYSEVLLIDRSGLISCPLAILKKRVQGKAVIVHLESIANRTQAEKVEDYGVLLARKHLAVIGEDEYYWHQYQDKLVVDLEGNTIGRVDHLFTNGAQDILVIKAGKEEILIPVTKSILVGESAGSLIVNPPPGLIEINSNSGN
ncbi:MAG: ribosome maturation factor RimM [Proteobacteria bacterium]|nr:ribosome maturation factor RimM [Pseudomonadota bacterium]